MPYSTTVLAVIVIYLAVNLLIGMWPGKSSSKTVDGYVAGDRTLGLLLMYFITGATIFSAFAFLGGPGWAYSRGAAAFYILGYGALGLVPFYFLGPRAARLGRRFGYVTQAEMVADRFQNPTIAAVMALGSFIAFVPYLALQMTGAGYVVFQVTGGKVPEWAGAAVVYSVVLIYVLRSGVLGVGWTNTFQGLFMMALAWGLGLYLPHKLYGGVAPMFERILETRPALLESPGLAGNGEPWAWGEYSSAVLVSALGFTAWPHLFMKAFTAANERTIQRTVVLYPTFQIFLVPLFLIGFCGVLFASAPDKPDQILPHMLMNMEIPALLVGLFCAGALAASMSSGDAMAHAAASIVVRDGLVKGLGQELSSNSQRRLIRIVVVITMVVSYVVALTVGGDIVKMLLFAYGVVVQFAPALWGTLYLRRVTGTALLAGMVLGWLVTFTFNLWPELRPHPLHPGLYGLVANAAVLWLISRLHPPKDGEGRDGFLEVAAGKSR